MKVREVMTHRVIRISSEETVATAARMLSHYNVGALPVTDQEDRICGMITDRDIVLRVVAAQQDPQRTLVRHIMSGHVVTVGADTDLGAAAEKMAREQVRRLPVEDQGRLCGMVTLGDLAVKPECCMEAAEALSEICQNVSNR